VSFNYGATVSKASDVKKALHDQRDALLKTDTYDASRNTATEEEVAGRRGELEELTDAAIAGTEAVVRKLPGRSGFQVTVSGHRDTDGLDAVGISVRAIP
jgi:hypothetical protein